MKTGFLLPLLFILTACFGGGGGDESGGGLFINHQAVEDAFTVQAPVAQTYSVDGNIEITLVHPYAVDVTGTPELALTIGASNKAASYVSGSGTANLLFRYTVVDGDEDLDGIALGSSINLNGGTLSFSANGQISNANTVLVSSALPVLKVITSGPVINSVSIPSNQTYTETQDLNFTLNTSQAITVTGTPRVKMNVGGSIVYADYASGSGSSNLVFTYTVPASMEDLDGVAHESPVQLNGGTLKNATGADLDLTFTPQDTSLVLVDSVLPEVLSVTAPANATYLYNEDVDFIVNMSESTVVTGSPRLVLDVGGAVRYAVFSAGSGTTALTFTYTVGLGDADADGIAVSNNNIDLNAGVIFDGANGANLSLIANAALPDLSAVIVDGDAPSIVSVTLPGNATYTETQNLDFTVNFDKVVNIVGSPRIAITLNSGTVYANYVSGTGSMNILFRYTVGASDYDNNGISLVSPLDLNGATIKDGPGNNAALSYTPGVTTSILVDAVVPTVSITTAGNINSANHTTYQVAGNCSEDGRTVSVNVGGLAFSPTCTGGAYDTGAIDVSTVLDNVSVAVTADHDDAAGNNATQASVNVIKDTTAPSLSANAIAASYYVLDDIVLMTVQFDEVVVVTGNPRVALTFNTQATSPIYLAYTAGTGSDTLSFTYTIVAGDEDLDGMDVGASIDLNAGTIKDAAGNNAALGLASTNFSSALVDSSVPTVTAFIEPIDGIYGEGGVLLMQASFDEAVVITGSPRIALNIGGSVKYATYLSGSGSTSIEFSYTTLAGEEDLDGIEITSTSIDLNSGTIKDAAGNNASLDFSAYKDATTGVTVNTTSGITAPDQVINLVTAPSTSNTELSLAWLQPNDNGTAIIDYTVQYRELGDTTWINATPNPTVNQKTIGGLTAGVTYEFRVAANNGLLGPFSAVESAEIFDLTSLNLALWLDASDSSTLYTDTACSLNVSTDGDTVGCWADKSGNGQTYLQPTAGYRPTYKENTINGKDGLDFDGAGDFLVDEDGENYINGFDAFEFFVVVKADVTNTDKGILDTKTPNGADDGITLRYDKSGISGGCSLCMKGGIEVTGGSHVQSESATGSQSTSTQLVGATWATGGKFDIYVNGSLSQSWNNGTLSGTTANAQKFLIGKGPKDTSASSGWDGRIVEIVFLNTQTAAGDRTKLMNYLKTKWGIP